MKLRYIASIVCGLALVILTSFTSHAQDLRLATAVYNGGGDWYANPTALKNLSQFCNQHLKTQLTIPTAEVELGSPELFNYPFVHLTGHGRWVLNSQEAQNIRQYLIGGGFLHIDDNYGLDPYVRPALKLIFPELELKEVPFSHPIYHYAFDFKNGLPKIHEHDNKVPKGYGLFYKNRLVVFYSYETDLGDGWEDEEVHNDSPSAREQALKMGANLVKYSFDFNK